MKFAGHIGAGFILGSILISGCWTFQPGKDPVTGAPTPSPAAVAAGYLPFPWNLLAAAALPTVTTLIAAREAKRRAEAIRNVAAYADAVEISKNDEDIARAKAVLLDKQMASKTHGLVQKLRGKK